MFFGQCVPHDGVTVMPYSVDAGVEEIMGFGCPVGMSGSGMGMLLGSRTATPQRLLWCGSMPIIVSLVSFVGFG